MNSSMYILEQWLRRKGYKIQSAIRDGSARLRSARITEDNSLSGIASISVGDEKTGLIKITNLDDLIFIIDSCPEKVFNQVNAAFDYYNAWESSLLRGVFEGNSLQELLDIAQLAFLRPMVIQNSRYEIMGITDSYGAQIHPIWRDYLNAPNRSLPFRLWYFDTRFNYMTERSTVKEPKVFYSKTYGGNFVLANIFQQDVRVAHITMYEHNIPFSEADLQLMRAFQDVITFYVNADNSVLFKRTPLDAFLEQELSEDVLPNSKVTVKDVYKATGWSAESLFAFLFFYLSPDSAEDAEWIQNHICEFYESTNTIILKNGVGALLALRSTDDYEKLGSALLKTDMKRALSWGLSQPFTGLQEIRSYCAIAETIALTAYNSGKAGMLMRDAGMSMILDDNSCNSVIRRLIHPEYLMLTEYDRVNNTQLATTMFWFLRCNCSYSNTAEKMDTHRNTVYYRVMKAF